MSDNNKKLAELKKEHIRVKRELFSVISVLQLLKSNVEGFNQRIDGNYKDLPDDLQRLQSAKIYLYSRNKALNNRNIELKGAIKEMS